MFKACNEILKFLLKRVSLAQWESRRAEIITISAAWMQDVLKPFEDAKEFNRLFSIVAKNTAEIISARVALLNQQAINSTVTDEEIYFLQAQITDFPAKLQKLHQRLSVIFGSLPDSRKGHRYA